MSVSSGAGTPSGGGRRTEDGGRRTRDDIKSGEGKWGASPPKEVKETLVCGNKVTLQPFSARFPEIPRYPRSQIPSYTTSDPGCSVQIQTELLGELWIGAAGGIHHPPGGWSPGEGPQCPRSLKASSTMGPVTHQPAPPHWPRPHATPRVGRRKDEEYNGSGATGVPAQEPAAGRRPSSHAPPEPRGRSSALPRARRAPLQLRRRRSVGAER